MKSGKLNDRDRLILKHIARYRFSVNEVLGALFFDGGDPQKVLDRLREADYIVPRKVFRGNRSAYQLQPKGVAAIRADRRSADALGSESLPVYSAIFAFCLLCGRSRIRLGRKEMSELFDGDPPSGRHHCLERSPRAKRLYHTYVPGEGVPLKDIIDATRDHVAEAQAVPGLETWLNCRVYSHAVLVDCQDRADELKAAMHRATDKSGRLLCDVAHIRIERVPGIGEMEEAIHAFAQNTSGN